jgi:hypothetical protein
VGYCRVPERSIQVMCAQAPLPSQYSTALYLIDSIQRTTEIDARHRLRSTAAPTLLTRRSTFRDRAFSLAAARAWYGLSAATVRDATPTFSSQRKTILFGSSCGKSQCWQLRSNFKLLLQTRMRVYLFVKCPNNTTAFTVSCYAHGSVIQYLYLQYVRSLCLFNHG